VVDASVALKWVLRERDSSQALALLASRETLLVPDFWLNEAVNVLWLQVHRHVWTSDEARHGLMLLRDAVPPTQTADMGLHPVALGIALAIDHSPYDCLYAAFAIAMGAGRMVTADVPFMTAHRQHPDPRLARLPVSVGEWAAMAGQPLPGTA
jgi:predicted nucleic acid-binding protein